MKKITIKEVAEAAGVSKTTVSRFLNGNYGNMSKETKERIEQIIERLNYRPSKQAQALKSKHSYLIGVVVADISNLYSSLLLKGIGSVLESSGYQMIIMDAANSVVQEKQLLEKLIDQQVDGIILQPSSRHSETYAFLAERRLPVLMVDRQTTPERWPSVVTNNMTVIEELLEQAFKKEYAEVVVVTEPVEEVSTRQQRYQAVAEGAAAFGRQSSLREITALEELDEVLPPLLEKQEKVLLFATNGRTLMGLLGWLIEREIDIPGQIGITGFDDWSLTALIGPGVTSIEQPSRKIGEAAATVLLNLLKEENQQKETIVPSTIRWRHSV